MWIKLSQLWWVCMVTLQFMIIGTSQTILISDLDKFTVKFQIQPASDF